MFIETAAGAKGRKKEGRKPQLLWRGPPTFSCQFVPFCQGSSAHPEITDRLRAVFSLLIKPTGSRSHPPLEFHLTENGSQASKGGGYGRKKFVRTGNGITCHFPWPAVSFVL